MSFWKDGFWRTGFWNPGLFKTDPVGTPADTTPDAFAFSDVIGVLLSSVVESDEIVVAGIDTSTPITVIGGEYQINGGSWTSLAGTVVNGDRVKVRHISAATSLSIVNTILTIGGVSDTFTSQTLQVDIQPDAFSFASVADAELSVEQVSGTIVVTGINTRAPVSVSGGWYYQGGVWKNAPGFVAANDTIKVRHVSSDRPGTSVVTTLTIGGVSSTFTSTTKADDIYVARLLRAIKRTLTKMNATNLDQMIKDELDKAQITLEQGNTLPWFLRYVSPNIEIGVDTFSVKQTFDGFLEFYEDKESFCFADEEGDLIPIKRNPVLAEMLRLNPGEASYPKEFHLIGDEVRLAPSPSQTLQYRMIYYKSDPNRPSVTETLWTKNALKLMLGTAGLEVATILRDQLGMQRFAEMKQQGMSELFKKTAARDDMIQDYVMGDPD